MTVRRLSRPHVTSVFVPPVVVASPPSQGLSAMLANALQQTKSGAVRWQRKQTKRPGIFSTALHIEDEWTGALLQPNNESPITFTLTATYPENTLKNDTPASLHRWSIAVSSPSSATPQVLDGSLLSLSSAEASPIAALFQAVYASLQSPLYENPADNQDWVTVIEQLEKQVLAGTTPVQVMHIPPSMANPLAGVATVVQIGQTVTEAHPRLEITRCGELTQLVLRTVAGTKKQRWTEKSTLNDSIDALVRLATVAQKRKTTVIA
ncbi:MAG: hypothetical protein QE263_07545 [Vampirovibrionales bacterium]|nr:hypothetical protein [Vampirovibrionales bacterium]